MLIDEENRRYFKCVHLHPLSPSLSSRHGALTLGPLPDSRRQQEITLFRNREGVQGLPAVIPPAEPALMSPGLAQTEPNQLGFSSAAAAVPESPALPAPPVDQSPLPV